MATKQPALSQTWIRASVLGTTWAASEIVLGSFIHNLRIPFGSNLLTGIGIVILVSSAYIWKEKGLFWRAGLICALMKSLSPSAVIFGPMIAIFSEAALMEISVRILGINAAGLIAGGILAMSWNLFHKAMNLLVIYGSNVVEIYAELMRYAEKQLHFGGDLVWTPVLLLWALYGLMGVAAALAGIRVGRRLVQQPAAVPTAPAGRTVAPFRKTGPPFRHSPGWLVADLLLLPACLVVLNFLPWFGSIPVVTLVGVIWATRYRQALRRLSKPRFWIWFVAITMLAALVFGVLQKGSLENALMTGLLMNVRAVVLILGFSALGAELSNPQIRDRFLRTSFRQLPLALELSFESLPMMIASLPEGKTLARNPVSALHGVLSQIDRRVDDLKRRLNRQVILISGPIRSGKTSYAAQVAEAIKSNHLAVAGILSLRMMDEDETTGYDVTDLRTGRREPFLRLKNDLAEHTIGRFGILEAGLQAGIEALTISPEAEPDAVIIDETGRLELGGNGWAGSIEALLAGSACHLILTVRDTYTEEVIRHWKLRNVTVVKPWQEEPEAVAGRLTASVS